MSAPENPRAFMSLRDYFAAAALTGLLSYIGNEGPEERESAFLQGLKVADASRAAYQFADAMLAERAKS